MVAAVLIAAAGASGAAAWAQSAAPVYPQTTPATVSKFTEQLTVPPVLDMTAGGAQTLDEVSGTHTFASSLPATDTWAYVRGGATGAGAYLGPTLEMKRGNPVDLTVNNKLSSFPTKNALDQKIMGVSPQDATAPRTVVHLHGGHDAAVDDGDPEATFRPGQSHTYHYQNDQEAAGLWYHDHALGMTRLGVVNGLAGQALVRDQYDTGRAGNALGLPTGASEIPLTLQDKGFNSDGSINYPVGTPGTYTDKWIPEFFGDTAVVNGKAFPNANVNQGLYRFHVLNATNARFWDLSLQSSNTTGATIYKIGEGGGMLNAPVRTNHLLIAPGDRADILVDFTKAAAGTTFVMKNVARTPYPSGARQNKPGGQGIPEVMQFTVGGAPGATTAVPTTLRGGYGQDKVIPAAPTPTNKRTVYLNEILDPTTGDSQQVLLNNLPWDSYRNGQIEKPKAGSVEEWDIVNTTGDAHPMHLHLIQFRILNRQNVDTAGYTALLNKSLPAPGLPDPKAAQQGPWPAPSADPYLLNQPVAAGPDEAGWSDVVIAPPGQVTRIIGVYGGTDSGIAQAPYTTTPADPTGAAYVWHCHILEHEDNDMMQQMRVMK